MHYSRPSSLAPSYATVGERIGLKAIFMIKEDVEMGEEGRETMENEILKKNLSKETCP